MIVTAGENNAASIQRLVALRLLTELSLCCSTCNISSSDFGGEGLASCSQMYKTLFKPWAKPTTIRTAQSYWATLSLAQRTEIP